MESMPIQDDMHARINPALAGCPLFRALKPEHYPQIIKLAEMIRFEDDEPIIRQGEAADSFYLIVNGQARVQVDKGGERLEIGRMKAPSSVGEMGLLLGEARTASVVSEGGTEVLKFNARAFDAMSQKIPNFGMEVSRGLATRLNELSGKIPLPEWDLEKSKPSADMLNLLPFDFVQRHRVLALQAEGNVLTLGLVDEPTPHTMNAVRAQLPSMEIRPVHIAAVSFNDVLQASAGVKGWTASGPAAAEPAAPAAAARSPRLDAMLERMVAEGASDVHISAGHKPRWRIDGEIHTMSDTKVLGPEEVLELLAPVMEERHRKQFAEINDVDLGYEIPKVARFRVNMFRDNHGVGAVLRQIPSKILTFEQLSLPAVLKTFCDMPKGLVLVTGPTGSGKSTTLAAMIDYINKGKKAHIITMEDPIEFVHTSQGCLVNQREVGGHTTSFGRALKAALREDPDIVLVGEMRDLETIQLALETANTGHLVFATLHTNTAVSSVDRVIDQFPADQQAQVRTVLSEVLRGVVSQMLLKKKGGGRVAAIEVLVVTQAMSALIREGKTVQIPGMMQASKGQGMQLLNDELYEFIEDRKVDYAEAMSKAVEKDDLARRFRAGLSIAADPPSYQRFRVTNVTPDSPAALAGLARGDYILEIGGKPAKDFTVDEVKILFRTDGRHLITPERSGKRLKPVTMELKR